MERQMTLNLVDPGQRDFFKYIYIFIKEKNILEIDLKPLLRKNPE